MRRALGVLLFLVSCLFAANATAESPAKPVAFDIHVHLREGEASLREYTTAVAREGIQVAGVGAMWFGGPHQALVANPEDVRARNDALIALADQHPEMIPIATVHPYDGQAALDEVVRLARRGIKILKIHPHTQKFDVTTRECSRS